MRERPWREGCAREQPSGETTAVRRLEARRVDPRLRRYASSPDAPEREAFPFPFPTTVGLWEWETGNGGPTARSAAHELVAAVGPDGLPVGDERRERVAHRGGADLGEVAHLALRQRRCRVGEDTLDAFAG